MQQTAVFIFLKFLLHDVFFTTFFFPIWWYSRGLQHAWRRYYTMMRTVNNRAGFGMSVRYLFTPMYGQRDIQGRLISFAFRALELIVRGVFFAVTAVAITVFFIAWGVAPAFAVWQLIELAYRL